MNLETETLATIRAAQETLLRLRRKDGSWQLPAYLGPVYVCQFYLLSRWAGLPIEFDETAFAEVLLRRQLPDGSWYQLKDVNDLRGNLNVTILTYWTLKAMGHSPQSAPMRKARAYILQQGGLSHAEIFLVAIFALFGITSWEKVPATPYVSFVEKIPMNYRSFSHWAKPHMLPFAYLRRVRARRDLGDRFALDELKMGEPPESLPAQKKPSAWLDGWILDKLLAKQGKNGSWNGYTTSTIFSVVALSDYLERGPGDARKIRLAIGRGTDFLKGLYLHEDGYPWMGITCDGTHWETILTTTALLGTGVRPEFLQSSLKFLGARQTKEGGMPYGMDFDTDPDVDDTSAVVQLWALAGPRYRTRAQRALRWLMERQNADGGWGAFDQDNKNNPLLNIFLRGYGDVESLFDYSSADCTGHVLAAMATQGFTVSNSVVARRAVAYLKARQSGVGGWQGRWALNYLYGTYAALEGLLAAGEPVESPCVRKALRFLRGRQNADGGFGESTLSYGDAKWAGKGESTPTQTAWTLMALIAAGKAESEYCRRAARYLTHFFRRHGKWFDPSVTATGHPGQAYMQYSVYAPTFPLLALGHYLSALGQAVPRAEIEAAEIPFFSGSPSSVMGEAQV